MWCVAAEMVCSRSGSKMTMSASEPTAIVPLLREEAEHLGGGRRGQLDEAVQRDALCRDAAVVDERHAVLDAGRAVRNLGEVVAAELLLLLHAERAVVGGDDLQVVRLQALPQLRLIPTSRGAAASSRTSRPRSPRRSRRWRGRDTAGRSRRRRAGRGRAPRAPVRAHRRRRGGRCRRAPRPSRRGAMARWTPSASAMVGRVSAWYFGAVRPCCKRALDDLVDDDAVLGVHADETAAAPGGRHRAEDGRVVGEEDAGVGHEQLEARHALVHRLVQLRARARLRGRS